MDKTALVGADRETIARVMDALSASTIPVTFCDWNYDPQLDEWQLVIATPWYDSKGPRSAISQIIGAMQKAEIYKKVPMLRVYVRSPRDPIVRELEREAKGGQKEGMIHIVEHRKRGADSEYSVMFAPYSGRGGSLAARRFSGLQALREFLEDKLWINPSSVEEALSEIRYRGNASIERVMLSPKKLKQFGLAA